LKILHVDTGAEMRGGQYQVLLLLEALCKAGHDVKLLARAGSHLFREGTRYGISTIPCSLANVFVQSTKTCILHAHDARSHTIAAISSKAPFVVSRRVAFPVRRGLASRWKYSRPARYIAVSEYVARELESAGITPDRIDVVYDAVAPSQEGTWDATAPAVALASDDTGKGRAWIERASQISGIPVRFSSQLPADLRRASMFVYMTRNEGLGSAALLAMAMGIPVIASKVGGLAEVFEHARSGLYVSNDPEEAAQAMQQLRNSSGLASAIITNAKQRIRESFTVKKMLAGTIASYQRALDE
jgi:Glycosyl transferases group 1